MHNYYLGSKLFHEELSPMEKAGKNKNCKVASPESKSMSISLVKLLLVRL